MSRFNLPESFDDETLAKWMIVVQANGFNQEWNDLIDVLADNQQRIRELQEQEQQDSEYTRKLEVAVTAASLLPEKWRSRSPACSPEYGYCADELEQTLSGKLKPEQEK